MNIVRRWLYQRRKRKLDGLRARLTAVHALFRQCDVEVPGGLVQEAITILEKIARLESVTANVDATAFAWYTDGYLSDSSATTYYRDTAERWANKGWPVTPLYRRT